MKVNLVLRGSKSTQHALISLVRISGLQVSSHKSSCFFLLSRPSQRLSGEHLISGLSIFENRQFMRVHAHTLCSAWHFRMVLRLAAAIASSCK